jgi:hypothetical protein
MPGCNSKLYHFTLGMLIAEKLVQVIAGTLDRDPWKLNDHEHSIQLI